ncbi:MAG: DUF2807 domain-containing protein [Bacteroidia bacterium]|nr:DUF2807 domain-containing protein [Bacteroidia bacterium]
MKKQILIALLVAVTVPAVGQKKPKIKGSKQVVDVYQSLEPFSAIEVNDNLEIELTQSASNGYHIKADDNLIDIVKLEVIQGTLKISTINKIVSSKKLEIEVTFTDVSSIIMRGHSKVISKNKIISDRFNLQAFDDSYFELDLSTNHGSMVLNQNSRGELLLRGERSNLVLNDKAYLKGELAMDNIEITVNKRSDLNLKGEVTNLKLTASGSTDIKAKDLKTTFADLISSNSSDIYVRASKELKLYAQGKSYVYVYGNPEIVVDGLNDKSQIIKK